MKTKDYIRIGQYAIVLLIFNVIYFWSGVSEKNTTTWISYTFISIGVLVSCFAPFLCIKYKRIPENLVTIYLFAWLYTIITLIFNMALIALKISNIKLSVLVNIILLAIYTIQLMTNMLINNEVEKNIETIDAEREFVNASASKLKTMMQIVNNDNEKRIIEKAYDAVRTSPIHSKPAAMDLEIDIMGLVDLLDSKVNNSTKDEIENLVNKIISDVKRRNSLL